MRSPAILTGLVWAAFPALHGTTVAPSIVGEAVTVNIVRRNPIPLREVLGVTNHRYGISPEMVNPQDFWGQVPENPLVAHFRLYSGDCAYSLGGNRGLFLANETDLDSLATSLGEPGMELEASLVDDRWLSKSDFAVAQKEADGAWAGWIDSQHLYVPAAGVSWQAYLGQRALNTSTRHLPLPEVMMPAELAAVLVRDLEWIRRVSYLWETTTSALPVYYWSYDGDSGQAACAAMASEVIANSVLFPLVVGEAEWRLEPISKDQPPGV